jgi:hypothetical protein
MNYLMSAIIWWDNVPSFICDEYFKNKMYLPYYKIYLLF